LEACKLLDPSCAEDLTAPWTPTLPDGEPDQDWANFSRMYAAGEMWGIICRWQARGAISLCLRSPDDGEWHRIYELTSELNEGDYERVDFVESRIRLDAWKEPVQCLLIRYDEDPSDTPIQEGANAGGVELPRFSLSADTNSKSRPPKGRPIGSGYVVTDAPLIEEMKTLIAENRSFSVRKAAERVVSKAMGGGTDLPLTNTKNGADRT